MTDEAVGVRQPLNLCGNGGIGLDRRVITAGLAADGWHRASLGALHLVMRVPAL